MNGLTAAILAAALCLSPLARAAEDGKAAEEKPAAEAGKAAEEKNDKRQAFTVDPDVKDAETAEAELTAVIAGERLAYVVKTGFVPLFSADGEQQARIFSTSYIKKDDDRERPVTFLFNGGPGSASVYLHAGSFAPMVAATRDGGLEMTAPPYKLTDNPDSLLNVTDLVFVDPVGTGYSHIVGKDDKDDKDAYWGVTADIASITEFIRVWLTQNDRWGARIFVGGESYGGLRAAGMAAALDDIGVAPSGVILISPAISYMDILPHEENLAAQILILPAMAAVAHYHNRLAPDLQEMPRERFAAMVREWCVNVLLPKLWRGNTIPEAEYEALAKEISRFIGISVTEVKAARLRLTADDFSAQLLRDRGVFLGLYDGRLTSIGSEYDYEEDPINAIAGEPYKTALQRFFTETLKMKTLRPYNYMSNEANAAWDFTQGSRGLNGYASTGSYLGRTMRRLPFFRVFLACGRYDLVTPAESAQQSIVRLYVPRERLANIDTGMYEGGHMMYTNPDARRQLAHDLRAWITGEPKTP